MTDEDADLRSDLAALGPQGFAALGRILSDPDKLDAAPGQLLAEPQTPRVHDLSTFVAMAATDEVVRLRLLRAIRDLGALDTR